MAILQYDFQIVGASAIEKAFASIERRAAQHNARMNRTFGTTGSRATGAGATGVTRPLSAERQLQMEQRRTAREAERLEKQKARAAERAARQKELAAKRAAAAEIREIDRVNRYWETQKRLQARHQMRLLDQQRRTAERVAMAEYRERKRAAGGMVGAVGRSAGGSLRAVGALGGSALAIGGGFAVSAAISSQMRENAMATEVANQSALGGNPISKRALLARAQGVRGFTGEEALGGIGAFVTKTGDAQAAQSAISELATLALATGSDLTDLGATAGGVFNVLKDQIADPIERMRELQSVMTTLAQQGAMGAVEIRDLATEFSKLGAATRQFEGGGGELIRTMGAFAQIAMEKGGASTSSDAATAAARLANDIVVNRKKFKAFNVSIKSANDPTKLRDPMEIMADVLEATGGDVEKTAGLFGMESAKIFRGVGATYSAAEANEKGSGRKAIMAEFSRYAGAVADRGQLEDLATSRMSDADMQFKEATKQFNVAVGQQLLPVLTKLIPEFAKLIPHATTLARILGKLASELADNPIMGIGKLIAAKVAWDIASARIGSVVRDAIVGGLTRGAPPPGAPVPTAGSAAGGTAKAGTNWGGAVLNGVSLGVMGAMTIMSSGIVNFEAREARIEQAGGDLSAIRDMSDPSQLPEARERLRRLEKVTQEESKPGIVESVAGAAITASKWIDSLGGLLGPMGGRTELEDVEHTKRAARDFANWTTARDEGAIQTAESFEAEARAKVRELERKAMEDAAKKQAEAADKLITAADKLSSAGGLNRGDTPSSPVKT